MEEDEIAEVKNMGDSSISLFIVKLLCACVFCLWPHSCMTPLMPYFGSHFTYTLPVYYNHFSHTDCSPWATLKTRYEVSVTICQLPWCHIARTLQSLSALL